MNSLKYDYKRILIKMIQTARGPKESKAPKSESPAEWTKLKKPWGPKVKKGELQKQVHKHKIFCSFFGQGAPKSDREARKS